MRPFVTSKGLFRAPKGARHALPAAAAAIEESDRGAAGQGPSLASSPAASLSPASRWAASLAVREQITLQRPHLARRGGGKGKPFIHSFHAEPWFAPAQAGRPVGRSAALLGPLPSARRVPLLKGVGRWGLLAICRL